MNTPVEHVVEVTVGAEFRINGDGEGFVAVDLINSDGDGVGVYMSRSEVNALIGALQNAVTFEWHD